MYVNILPSRDQVINTIVKRGVIGLRLCVYISKMNCLTNILGGHCHCRITIQVSLSWYLVQQAGVKLIRKHIWCNTIVKCRCGKLFNQWEHSFRLKAVLPLANRLVRASSYCSNTDPAPSKRPVFIPKIIWSIQVMINTWSDYVCIALWCDCIIGK